MPRGEDAPQPVAPGAITALLQQLVGADDGGAGWALALHPGAVIGRFELELLDRAVRTGGGYRSWIEHDSDLDALRRDPRFQAVLARLPP